MTARERVARARRRLAAAIAAEALCWAAVVAMAVVAVAAVLYRVASLSPLARAAIVPAALLAAAAAAALVLWRGRGARSIENVALWVEERDPSLRYALAAAVDERRAPADSHPDLHRLAAAAEVEQLVGEARRKGLGRALVTLAATAAVLAALRPAGLLRGAETALGRGLGRGAAPASRLAGFSAIVTPPEYSRLPPRTLHEPSDVVSLVGSAVTFTGRGSPEGLAATLDSARYEARAAGNAAAWAVSLTMPRAPAVAVLSADSERRLVTMVAVTDSAPVVRLDLPLHDTTYQAVPRGSLAVAATLHDDIGLNFGYVEYMVTAGGGENFTTRLINGPHTNYGNARSAALRASVALDTMKLAAGDVIHIRVVAYDYNNVTGPGIGVSETRTLRIAERPDSTSINPAPPLPIDSMWISQRLLNMKTDTLIRRERRIARDSLEHTSSAYSNVQEAIRQKALAVIGLLEQTGEGSSFQTEISSKLREAADLMWTAREDLGIALPDTAMPYMIRILKILDEIRLANRYYIRGILKPVPVNVERVRLTGKDPARVSPRGPRPALSDTAAALLVRLEGASALARTAPSAAADSLTYIRVTALVAAPGIARALEDAIARLRRGLPADSVLARARLALEPPARLLTGPAAWGGVLP